MSKVDFDLGIEKEKKSFDWKAQAKAIWKWTKPYRSLILYGYFCIHCLVGMVIFYYIEVNSDLVLDSKVTATSTCIGGNDLWGALFFAIAASSTIGFGILYPCTLITRILAILYSMVGIPLFIAVLAKFGDHFYELVVYIYMPFWRKLQEKKEAEREKEDQRRKRKREKLRRSSGTSAQSARDIMTGTLKVDETGIPLLELETLENFDKLENGTLPNQSATATPNEELSDDQINDMVAQIMGSEEDEEPDKPDLPVSLGFLLILVCIALCSIFYYYMEGFAVFDSIYYGFLTFLAGDFSTETYYLGVPVYILLFIGFSMVSTTISIVQNNIENLMKRVKREVRRELARQIADAAAEGRDINIDTSKLVSDVMKKHGGSGLMKNLISEEKKETFQQATVEKCEKIQSLTYGSVEIQTDESSFNRPPTPPPVTAETSACQTLLEVVDEVTEPWLTTSERQTETDTVTFRSQKVQMSPTLSSSATSMPSVTKRDKSTSQRPVSQHKSTQSPRKVFLDKISHVSPSSSSKIAQASPSSHLKATDTRDLVVLRTQGVGVAPVTRTAKVQVELALRPATTTDSSSTPGAGRTFSHSERLLRTERVRARWKHVIGKVMAAKTLDAFQRRMSLVPEEYSPHS